MDRAVYDRMAEIDREHWWFSARRKIIDCLIREQVPLGPDAHILEVGCGTGSNIALLQQFGTVEAVEPDDQTRSLAAKRTGATIWGGQLPDGVELSDDRYDMIAMFDVLEHIADDDGALAALRPKLSATGRLVATVPANPWLWSGHDVAHHHRRRYTSKSLSRVFQAAGYKIRHLTHFNSLLFPLIASARGVGRALKREDADDAIPPAPLNTILERIFALESHWVCKRSLPFGVSLAIVAEPGVSSGQDRLH